MTAVDDKSKSNVLNGYKFSINDFNDTQLNQMKLTNVRFKKRNATFKNRLFDEILIQEKERRQFYWKVANQRSKQTATKMLHGLFGRLPMAEKFLPSKSHAVSDMEAELHSKYKHWTPTETLHEAATKEPPHINSILCMPLGTEKLSSVEQIKMAFMPRYYVPNYSRYEQSQNYNFQYLTRMTLLSSLLMGGLLGMEYGARFLHDFDKAKANQYFRSKADMYYERYRAFLRGFVPYWLRWTWRCSFLIGGMLLISQTLMIWRKKDKMSNYLAGAAVPGALYKWKKGPKGMFVSAVMFSCMFGIPFGFLNATCGLNPRTCIYDWFFMPLISSSAHCSNWTEEQKQKNKLMMTSMLREIKTYKNAEDTKNSPIYQSLFPSILHKVK